MWPCEKEENSTALEHSNIKRKSTAQMFHFQCQNLGCKVKCQ